MTISIEQLIQEHYAIDYEDSLTSWFPKFEQALIAHPLYLNEYNGFEDASITFFFVDINGLLCELSASDVPCYHHNPDSLITVEIVTPEYVMQYILENSQQ